MNDNFSDCIGLDLFSVTLGSIQSSVTKFGDGAAIGRRLSGNPSNAAQITPVYSGSNADTVSDAGAFGFWVKVSNTNEPLRVNLQTLQRPAGDCAFFDIYVVIDQSAPQFSFAAVWMKNALGNDVIDSAAYFTETLDTEWHYWEANWLWNDANGYTKVFWDGVEVFSTDEGNAETREGCAGGTYQHIKHANITDNGVGNPELYIDDFFLEDSPLHSSNFSIPTTAQALCCPDRHGVGVTHHRYAVMPTTPPACN